MTMMCSDVVICLPYFFLTVVHLIHNHPYWCSYYTCIKQYYEVNFAIVLQLFNLLQDYEEEDMGEEPIIHDEF